MGRERSFALIANPHAGHGRGATVLADAQRQLRAAGATVAHEPANSIEHARRLAEQAAGAGVVAVAVGGDGMVRAVAAGAAAHRGTIGIVPAGRGNDFARTLGLGRATEAAVAVLLTGSPRATDCIGVRSGDGEEEVVAGNVYVGFDSLSNAAANAQRVNLGRFSYTAAALRVTLTMPTLEIALAIDGGAPERYRGSGVVIANSAYYGSDVQVAPGADPHDGLLDVVRFHQRSPLRRVPAMLALRTGRHLERDDVDLRRAREVRVELEPALEAYADGDPVCRTPLTARVLPGAISVLLP